MPRTNLVSKGRVASRAGSGKEVEEGDVGTIGSVVGALRDLCIQSGLSSRVAVAGHESDSETCSDSSQALSESESSSREISPPRTRPRSPSMCKGPGNMIPARLPCDNGKLTVVLDLDETLVYAREGPVIPRPGLDGLFKLLHEQCETIVWTAGVKGYSHNILNTIDKYGAVRHCVYRHEKWFPENSPQKNYVKDLKLLGRDMEHTIIIENTPDCVVSNPDNAVIVADYTSYDEEDPTVPAITHVLRSLIESQLTVPQFLQMCPQLRLETLRNAAGSTLRVNYIDCYPC